MPSAIRDPSRREADELRAAIQRQLLEAARLPRRPAAQPSLDPVGRNRPPSPPRFRNEVSEVPLHQFRQRRSLP